MGNPIIFNVRSLHGLLARLCTGSWRVRSFQWQDKITFQYSVPVVESCPAEETRSMQCPFSPNLLLSPWPKGFPVLLLPKQQGRALVLLVFFLQAALFPWTGWPLWFILSVVCIQLWEGNWAFSNSNQVDGEKAPDVAALGCAGKKIWLCKIFWLTGRCPSWKIPSQLALGVLSEQGSGRIWVYIANLPIQELIWKSLCCAVFHYCAESLYPEGCIRSIKRALSELYCD